MSFDEYLKQAKDLQETQRRDLLVMSTQKLANEQHKTNTFLKEQCNALEKRNEILEKELINSQKATRRSMVFNIISCGIAVASLVATILLNVLR